jgi:putative phosphoesterase
MRIVLFSDTHGFLDDALIAGCRDCDEIWHAGDFGTAEVLDGLKEVGRVRGVFGNVDGPELRSQVPEDLEWSSGSLRFYMTHIGGYPGRYDPRARRELEQRKPDVFICGHSHVVRVVRDQKLGLLHLNPGASGHAGWYTERTAMRFEILEGRIEQLEVLALGKRGRKYSAR